MNAPMTVKVAPLCKLQAKLKQSLSMTALLRQWPSVATRISSACIDKALACACLGILLGVGSMAAHAQSHFEQDFDDKEKAWAEIAVQLPAPPKRANLLEFYVSPIATQTFAVDAESLSAGNDGVVRYTLVSRSASGAENISYEGIRCESFEKKLYAFGHKNGSWTRSRRDQWEPITGTIANRHHAALARDYFCSHKVVDGNAEQIIRRIRDKTPRAQHLPTL